MQPQALSQHDPRWASLPLGTSHSLIKDFGCTLDAVSMKFGVTPDFLNDQLNKVGGFAPSNPSDPYNPENNLIIWKKLEEALPGAKFVYKYPKYDNTIVLQSLPCIVEVNAKPIGGVRHWVLYIGGGMLLDPWDGKEKPTSTYEPLSFVVMSGEYSADKKVVSSPISSGNYYKGLDMSNADSVKAAIDTWKDVVDGKYVSKETYDQVNNRAWISDDVQKKYAQFVALGYTTVDDVHKVIEKANAKIIKLLQDTAVLEKKNYSLASTIADESKNSYTAIDEALSTLNENKELKEGVAQIAQVVDADKPSIRDIVSKIFSLKDISDRLLAKEERTTVKPETPISVAPQVEMSPTKKLLSLLNLIPLREGVK